MGGGGAGDGGGLAWFVVGGMWVGGGLLRCVKGFGVGRAWECGVEKRVGCSGGWEVGGWILGGALMGGGKHGLGDIECCGRLEAVGLDVQGKGVGL